MRIPPARLWVPAAAAVLGAGAILLLAAIGALPWHDSLELAALFLSLLSLGLVLLLVQRTELFGRRLARHRERQLSDQKKLAQRLASDRKKLTVNLRKEQTKVHARLREMVTAVGQKVSGLQADVGKLREAQARGFEAAAAHVTHQGRRDYEQQVAWHQLHKMLEPERYMPALRGWAASPDVLCLLVEAIRDRRPGLVVECGSGASTVWLGLAMRRFGRGRLVALEHEERYAELSRELVAAHGLSDIVEVRLAPLRPWASDEGGGEALWYDLDSVADLSGIDVVFIDGPPRATGPQARYPAGPVLFPRCSPRCLVVLDDAAREDEQVVSDRWMEEHPDFQRSTADTEKGAHLLERGAGGAPW